MEELSPRTIAVLSGLLIGLVFGVTVHRSNFCMMGAVADMTLAGDTRRLRGWLLAIAVAMLGVQLLQLFGVLDLRSTIYLAPRFLWVGPIAGGLTFGFGMVIACGCGSRSLVNFATGDLKALVGLIFLAIGAYTTLHGLTAMPRVMLENASGADLTAIGLTSQGLIEAGAEWLALPEPWVRTVVGLGLGAALIWYCFSDSGFRRNRPYVAAGIIIGLLVVAGWFATGVLAADDFDDIRLASLTFVAPVGNSLQYLMVFTGSTADFGIATVGGVIAGGALSAALNRGFRLQAFEDVHDLTRYMVGGLLMGVGGVTALGCTIGQGITGISTLGLGSVLATLSIVGGGVLGTRYLEQGSLAGAVKAVFGRA